MSEEVRRSEFDLYRGATDARIARVEHDLDDAVARSDRATADLNAKREADLERIRAQREADVQAAALALTAALKELGESRNTSWVRRVGAVGAAAGVVAAWVALIELLNASGR